MSDADDEDSPVKRSSAKRARVQRAVLSSSEDEAEEQAATEEQDKVRVVPDVTAAVGSYQGL